MRQFLPPGYDRQSSNYSTGGYLPRRLEATAPTDQLSSKRAMSGTGNRIVASSSAIPTAQTQGIYPDRNGTNNYTSKQSLGPLQTDGRSSNQPFSTKGSAQPPPQMLVQPNMPMQHYATSGGSGVTGSSATGSQVPNVRTGSTQGSSAHHIIKIKRPASRDHMASQAVQMGSN